MYLQKRINFFLNDAATSEIYTRLASSAASDVYKRQGADRAASAHRRLALVRGRGACAHPDGSAAFVGSALDALADELAVHQHHGRCGRPASTVLPTPEEGTR
ncbi:hypothetical protein AERO_12595 [Aeromicrobium fastidiosum]|uniref:hypothetical protein n=1 Tax=Aeromicrobium fastidiosum TaxID=52699 RepID=UPI0020237BA5|nr:hypothetical protein [Aeromicrobium fastidiosum]MCL8252225.1 hypothetical protein [Aeromicrobium fastidiosum]